MATPRQPGRVGVQMVCVADGRNFVKEMLVPMGQTVGWCVNASGVVAVYGNFRAAKLGVWGKTVKPETVVAEGDRIEVYVACSPEAVKKARQMKMGGIAEVTDLGDNGG